MTRCYPLISFQPEQNTVPSKYSVDVFTSRQAAVLTLKFHVNDPSHEIDWPETQTLERRDYLWENTCFEAFMGAPNQSEYFELNLSPSLAWNLYRFTDYRTPNDMPPITVLEPALIKFDVNNNTISVEIDLTVLKLADVEITLGLTAVIKTADSIEYLALHHPKSEADFHDPQGWTVRLLPDAQ